MKLLKIFLTIFLLIRIAVCNLKERIDFKIHKLRLRSVNLYGDEPFYNTGNAHVKWTHQLAYPRGDKRKLHTISKLWMKYYECTARTLDDLTPSYSRPVLSRTVYEGAAVQIPCMLCVSPVEKGQVAWFYAMSLTHLTFEPVQHKDTSVMNDEALTMYHANAEDAGVYRCQVGRSVGGLVSLEVVDYEESYNVVKPFKSHGPYPAPALVYEDLYIFSAWSPWTECSACDKVGRYRRYGICQVETYRKKKHAHYRIKNKVKGFVCENGLKVLEAFPKGVACRSKYLPQCIKNIPVIRMRNSEIMLGLCKVPCNNSPTVDTNMGTDQVLTQTKLTDIPLPARDIVFAVRLQPIVIRCPGSARRDMPVSWRMGTKRVVPLALYRGSAGRAHVNARDHVVFTTVYYSDDGVYSCWQGEQLAGVVRLHVWRGPRSSSCVCLLATVAVSIVLFISARRLYNAQMRRLY